MRLFRRKPKPNDASLEGPGSYAQYVSEITASAPKWEQFSHMCNTESVLRIKARALAPVICSVADQTIRTLVSIVDKDKPSVVTAPVMYSGYLFVCRYLLHISDRRASALLSDAERDAFMGALVDAVAALCADEMDDAKRPGFLQHFEDSFCVFQMEHAPLSEDKTDRPSDSLQEMFCRGLVQVLWQGSSGFAIITAIHIVMPLDLELNLPALLGQMPRD